MQASGEGYRASKSGPTAYHGYYYRMLKGQAKTADAPAYDYVVRGRARMRWGERLEFTAEAGPGDFIYVPPYVPHQEINASPTEQLECVLCRSDGEAVAVNLDIEPAEAPEQVLWVDPTHPKGGM